MGISHKISDCPEPSETTDAASEPHEPHCTSREDVSEPVSQNGDNKPENNSSCSGLTCDDSHSHKSWCIDLIGGGWVMSLSQSESEMSHCSAPVTKVFKTCVVWEHVLAAWHAGQVQLQHLHLHTQSEILHWFCFEVHVQRQAQPVSVPTAHVGTSVALLPIWGDAPEDPIPSYMPCEVFR